MAEFVQLRLESIIPMLKEMEKNRMVPPELDIKNLAEKFEAFEYKMQRMDKNIDNFFEYLNFTADLLIFVESWNSVSGHALFTKNCVLDWDTGKKANKQTVKDILRSNIGSVLEIASRSFCYDISYWKRRIQLLKKLNWPQKLSSTYELFLSQFGSTHPLVWSEAAMYQWKRNPLEGYHHAMSILMKGLNVHENNLPLYFEVYKLNVIHWYFITNKLKDEVTLKMRRIVMENQEAKEWIQKCEKATEYILQHCCNRFNESKDKMEIYTYFLEKVQQLNMKLDFFENQIYNRMQCDCSIGKEGVLFCIYEMDRQKVKEATELARKLLEQKAISPELVKNKKLLKKFSEAAMNCIQSSQDIQVASLFLDIIKDCQTLSDREELWNILVDFSKLLRLSTMPPLDVKEPSVLLKQALSKYSKSALLKKQSILYDLENQSILQMPLLLKEMKSLNLNDNSETEEFVMQVFKHIRKERCLRKSTLKFINFNHPPGISSKLKLFYLNLLLKKKQIKKARKFFESQYKCPPVSSTFLKRLMKSEMKRKSFTSGRITKIRKYFDFYLAYHGTKDAGLWIDYIKFEKKMKSNRDHDLKRSAELRLDKELIEIFFSSIKDL